MVTRLYDGKCDVQCGGDMVSGLLFKDDMSLDASDEKELKKSLNVLLSGVKSGG